jgi:DNA polymerase V
MTSFKKVLSSALRQVGAEPVQAQASSGASLEASHSRRVGGSVQGGFPSPAEDLAVERIDLNKELIRHPDATFLMRVRGESMREAGIDDGDVIVVDRALNPSHGHVVVAILDGEFTVKRLFNRDSILKLQAANPSYEDIIPAEGQVLEIWGVVTTIIKTLAI